MGNLVNRLRADLTEEIYHCLCSQQSDGEPEDAGPCRREAAGTAREFLARIEGTDLAAGTYVFSPIDEATGRVEDKPVVIAIGDIEEVCIQ